MSKNTLSLVSKLLTRLKSIDYKSRLTSIAATLLGAVALIFVLANFPSVHTNYLYNKAGDQVVKLVNPSNHNSGGTGFAVTAPSGAKYILTNRHVCVGVSKDGMVEANFPDNSDRYYQLRIREVSKTTDLCLLEPLPGKKGLPVANSFSIGEEVNVVGHPFLEHTTLARGIFTNYLNIKVFVGAGLTDEKCAEFGGVNEMLTSIGFDVPRYLLYQQPPTDPVIPVIEQKPVSMCFNTIDCARTTAVTYPGNSGSPVVDVYGRVVAVLFAGNGMTNYGFVIPLREIKKFLNGR